MATTTTPAPAKRLRPVAERATGAQTLGHMLLVAGRRGDDVALRYPVDGAIAQISYAQLAERCREIARGLIALGIEAGDRVSILGTTRAEWTLCDFGTICAGAIVAPIYHTNSPAECAHVLGHSQARLVFCEDADQVAKIAQIRADCPELEHVAVIDGEAPDALTLQQLCAHGTEVDPEAVDERIDSVTPDEVATLVYTSGTTGPAKGCMLTHSNFLESTRMYRDALLLDEVQPVIYMFLPLAHVLARVAQAVAIDVGGTIAFWSGEPKLIVKELAEIEPTHFPAVPRIYEKIHTAAISGVEEQGALGRAMLRWALGQGRHARAVERAGGRLGPLAAAQHRIADRLVLSKVRGVFGGRLVMAIVGAAPVSRDLLEFFDACGVLLLEGYGMTETCSTATLNPADAPRFGTVGRPLPESEVRIGDDGEILMRGPHVFKGYFRDEQATAEALEDGWLHSGDLGRLTDEGYLTVTGRKKDLIITSSGKNITPANLESALRETRWIADAVVYGDDRPYLVAMVTLDRDEAQKLAEHLGIPPNLATMALDERVHAALQADVEAVNAGFARIEQIKRFGVLDHDLTQADGELTPTLKVKRNVVYGKYADFFDGLYEDGGRR